MSRTRTSPYRYDRAAIRLVLETSGRNEALARWPKDVVDPIARVMGLTSAYRGRDEWDSKWTPLLGTRPDRVLAGELGVPAVTVSNQRRKLGIPTAGVVAYRRARQSMLAAISDSELVATGIDELAAKYQVGFYEIEKERRRRALQPNRTRRRDLDAGEMRRVAILAIKAAYPDATLEQIGEVVGCSRERVRQVLYVHEASREVAS